MKTKIIRYFIVSFTLAFVIWSCDKSTTETPQPQVLVSSTLVKELTKEQLIAALGSSLGSQASLFIRSGVKQYKIVYKTKNTDMHSMSTHYMHALLLLARPRHWRGISASLLW